MTMQEAMDVWLLRWCVSQRLSCCSYILFSCEYSRDPFSPAMDRVCAITQCPSAEPGAQSSVSHTTHRPDENKKSDRANTTGMCFAYIKVCAMVSQRQHAGEWHKDTRYLKYFKDHWRGKKNEPTRLLSTWNVWYNASCCVHKPCP